MLKLFVLFFSKLRLDVEELEKLEKLASRSRVKDFLLLQRKKVQTEIVNLESQENAAKHSPAVSSAAAKTTKGPAQTYTVKLSNYGELVLC